jgi:hypothetical protein
MNVFVSVSIFTVFRENVKFVIKFYKAAATEGERPEELLLKV